MANTFKWWQKGVIYQVYPRSFAGSNGDGVGDLRGITGRLEYLRWLGVDAVWLSPIYPSPMADFGYDISDYKDIHSMFGTLGDLDDLVARAHRLGLKVILDYVPNHTSDEHHWFLESRSSHDNPKRDWYIWSDPRPDGSPPNNWKSQFGGSAWEFDERTGQYYYHTFHRKQPDLNWRNPQVREAMLDVMRFWLDRGVDGFRVDALRRLIKDDKLRDNPLNPDYRPERPDFESVIPYYTADRPEVHVVIAEMRRVLEEYEGDRLMIGEIYLPIEHLMAYYGEDGSGVHIPTNMHLILRPWRAREISALINEYEAALPPFGWPNWVLGNHDRPRVASRTGPTQARCAAMLLRTLRGTPTIYYGDEIGMQNVPIPPDSVQDPLEKTNAGLGVGRDPERTPMQWTSEPNAGFCPEGVLPWLPLAEDYKSNNVAVQQNDPCSILSLHRHLLSLRRSEPTLSVGFYTEVEVDEDLLAYMREYEGRRFLVVLNFGGDPRTFKAGSSNVRGRVILSTRLDREQEKISGALELRGDEGVIVELD